LIETASDGIEGLRRCEVFDPDIVILDLHMPELDGYEVIAELRKRATGAFLPVLVYTADVTREARERALSLGASDFVTKPGERTEIMLRVRNLLALRTLQQDTFAQNDALEARVRERTRALEQAQVEIVNRLAMAGEYRDEDTGEHTSRVGDMCALIARELDLMPSDVATIKLAARLHDLGKIAISDLILLKPGKLTEEEFAQMRQHTSLGAKILADGTSPILQMAERIALTHHERFDGRGYPRGLAGAQIPIEGRITAIADVFDALTHARPYKEAWPVERAVAEIESLSGTHFDPSVVRAFLSVLRRSWPSQAA
jgi:putative two-component system response regulator